MNKPLGRGVTGLTLDLLAERIEHERMMREAEHQATQEALTAATSALEKRLEGMNEFREQLTEQTRTFLSRNEYEGKHEALIGRIAVLERQSERAAGSIATWRFLAGGGGLLGLVSIVLWILRPLQ